MVKHCSESWQFLPRELDQVDSKIGDGGRGKRQHTEVCALSRKSILELIPVISVML